MGDQRRARGRERAVGVLDRRGDSRRPHEQPRPILLGPCPRGETGPQIDPRLGAPHRREQPVERVGERHVVGRRLNGGFEGDHRALRIAERFLQRGDGPELVGTRERRLDRREAGPPRAQLRSGPTGRAVHAREFIEDAPLDETALLSERARDGFVEETYRAFGVAEPVSRDAGRVERVCSGDARVGLGARALREELDQPFAVAVDHRVGLARRAHRTSGPRVELEGARQGGLGSVGAAERREVRRALDVPPRGENGIGDVRVGHPRAMRRRRVARVRGAGERVFEAAKGRRVQGPGVESPLPGGSDGGGGRAGRVGEARAFDEESGPHRVRRRSGDLGVDVVDCRRRSGGARSEPAEDPVRRGRRPSLERSGGVRGGVCGVAEGFVDDRSFEVNARERERVALRTERRHAPGQRSLEALLARLRRVHVGRRAGAGSGSRSVFERRVDPGELLFLVVPDAQVLAWLVGRAVVCQALPLRRRRATKQLGEQVADAQSVDRGRRRDRRDERVERVAELRRGGEPFVRIARERAEEHARERRRIAGSIVVGSGTLASRTRRSVSTSSVSLKRRRSSVSSQSVTPRAKMSTRRSIAWPCACSGARYASLPLMIPMAVDVIRSRALASPKSMSFGTPSRVRNTFAGLTSRWMTCAGLPRSSLSSWAWCRPSAMRAPIQATTSCGRRWRRAFAVSQTSRSVWPRRTSIARKWRLPSCPRPWMAMTFGCARRDAIRASSRNIATKSLLRPCSARMTFSATRPPAPSCALPSQTLAIPPSEMGARTSYSPRRSNGSVDLGETATPDTVAAAPARGRTRETAGRGRRGLLSSRLQRLGSWCIQGAHEPAHRPVLGRTRRTRRLRCLWRRPVGARDSSRPVGLRQQRARADRVGERQRQRRAGRERRPVGLGSGRSAGPSRAGRLGQVVARPEARIHEVGRDARRWARSFTTSTPSGTTRRSASSATARAPRTARSRCPTRSSRSSTSRPPASRP